VPSSKEIEIVLRDPLDKNNTLSYFINLESHEFAQRWAQALEKNLVDNLHLEKNYCFLGWAKSPRQVGFLCKEINQTIAQINLFNSSGEWQKHGLEPYHIEDHFDIDTVMYSDKQYPIGNKSDDPNNLGLRLKHDPMNRLHRYFEDLQGEAWGLSKYYKHADYETKWAIRQLNVLCHELETWVQSYRQSRHEPEWQRPSQITTFLNAPRFDLHDEDYELFIKNRYDRVFGGVYLHWAQIGKTQFEVFRDEDGGDIDEATCSSINSLRYYSGEFDVEWGRDVVEADHEWHRKEQEQFREWLARNNFDYNDSKLSLGYIKIGQVDLEKSFKTMDFFSVIDMISKHLDIYKIKCGDTEQIYDYTWADDNYKQMQIDFLKPGYDWSKANV